MTDAKIGLADMPKIGDYYITTLVKNGTMLATIPLAGFDEWIIGYRDRSAVLPEIWHDEIMTKNGIFRPAIITNGEVVGKWEKPKKRAELEGDFWDRYIQFRNML